MRILLISHFYPPHIGGIETVVRQQAVSLGKSGHDVAVVAFAGDGERPGSTAESGVTVSRVRAWNCLERRFGIPQPLGGLSLYTTLRRRVAGADVVHLNDVFYLGSWAGFLLARRHAKRIVLTQHVGLVEHPSRLVTAVQRLVYRTAGRRIFAGADAIVVYNANVAAFLREQRVPPAKVTELRNGVDLTRFRPATSAPERRDLRRRYGLPVDRPLALFVGRMVPKKGIAALYEARSGAYDLVLVGGGEVPAGWYSTPGVHVLGAVPHEELPDLYRLADVFVFPAAGEIFTLAVQEAMASGLPIVTTNDDAYAGYGLDTERIALVPPRPDELRAAIEDITADPRRSAEMGAYSLALAHERFDWEKNIGAIEDVYAGVLAAEGAPGC
ncbi:MAG TPA: glycosyltransferase family 4 protein [Mycobacteriales bacterium]|nr:glycosyltransferase family 4 protein [Mycobacteriales bacterium]